VSTTAGARAIKAFVSFDVAQGSTRLKVAPSSPMMWLRDLVTRTLVEVSPFPE
jgi:hypothetical protein